MRALIGFGWLDDPRVVRAVEWQARAITGEGVAKWYRSGTSGPGFACGANEDLPCAWGAVKALGGLARVPVERRSPEVSRAIEAGADFLLSRDPAVADYPAGWGNTRPSGSWFKLGFPSGYVADVLQNLEVLAELGHARDPRLANAIDWLLGQAGRARPVDERVRLQRQDLGEDRATGTAQQMGHAAGLPLPPIRSGIKTLLLPRLLST